MTVLERILESKRAEISRHRLDVPVEDLQRIVREAPQPRSLAAALARRGEGVPELRVIAEVKKASPSKGVIRADFDAVGIARTYAAAGAAAISVITDEEYFQGHLEHLRAIRDSVSPPLLRKDFIVDPYQLWEARAAGADAVLLIAAALPDDVLLSLSEEAAALEMEVLWEVHDQGELDRVKQFSPQLVGINNRDLRTFEVNLETTRRLAPEVPEGAAVVSESGFFTREELVEVRRWGVDAFLIGESLLRAEDPGAALQALLEGGGGR